MEVVLLWIDELDDWLFAGALLWERLRRGSLQIGLVAAFTLAGCEVSAAGFRAQWVPPLAAVALASVGLWLVAAIADLTRRSAAKLDAAGA